MTTLTPSYAQAYNSLDSPHNAPYLHTNLIPQTPHPYSLVDPLRSDSDGPHPLVSINSSFESGYEADSE